MLPKEDQVPTAQSQVAFENMIASVNAVYYKLKKQEPAAAAAPTVQSPSPTTKMLPTIQLPTFEGKIEKWPEFIAIYD